jgi:hypothetical protein
MNKRHLSLLAAASIALFSACSNIVESTDSQAKLNVLVTNSANGKPVAGAKVTLVSKGETKTVDAGGLASFSGVPGGYHNVRIEAANYATVLLIDRVVNASPSVLTENIETVELDSLSARLIGYVYYQDKDNNIMAANGAKIRVTLHNDNLENQTIIASVGPDGKYDLNLPPVNVTLTAPEYAVGGVIYAESVYSSGILTPDATEKAPDFTYSYYDQVNTSSFILLNNREDIVRLTRPDSLDTLKLNFSDAIDSAKSSKAITVTAPADIIYSADKKTVLIVPLGKWPSGLIEVNINGLKSVGGRTYPESGDEDLYFSYTKEPVIITKSVKVNKGATVITASTLSVDITWDEIWNDIAKEPFYDDYYYDTEYKIYARASKGTDRFEEVDSGDAWSYCTDIGTVAQPKKSCTATVDLDNSYLFGTEPFGTGGKVDIVVQAVNSISKSAITNQANWLKLP